MLGQGTEWEWVRVQRALVTIGRNASIEIEGKEEVARVSLRLPIPPAEFLS